MNRAKSIVNARKVYKDGLSGNGIRIVVLDTGVASHVDLVHRVVFFRDMVNGKPFPYDDNGHGTHIAGILCGSGVGNRDGISGMAHRVELVVFKVLDQQGNGRTEDVIEALIWVRENRDKYGIKLLNFSMGFLPNSNKKEQEQILRLLEELWELGITVVTAAGNNGPAKFSVTVPGISKKLITVGAVDDFEVGHGRKQGYSGKGPTDCCIVKPEILAPGTKIVSLSKNQGYTSKSGSSMATPIVCGTLALCYEKNPSLTPMQMKLNLYEVLKGEPRQSYLNSWGLLNVDKLVDFIS